MINSGFGVGRIRWHWFAAFALLLAALPLVSETNTPTLLAIWALFALSLGLMWGYAGILSFGHAAYFGLGAYTYAIAVVQHRGEHAPAAARDLGPALVAAVIGAMMFYGRISDVYLGVMTLVVTLILNRFMNATAGRRLPHRQCAARRLQRHPGVSGDQRAGRSFGADLRTALLLSRDRVPARRLSGGTRDPVERLRARADRHPGKRRAHGAARLQRAGVQDRDLRDQRPPMAGLSGCLFANWAEIVTPSVFSLGQTAEVLIWVIVGGLGTLIGPMLGAVALGALKIALGNQTLVDNSLVLGFILILVVLLIPRGFAQAFVAWRPPPRAVAGAPAARRAPIAAASRCRTPNDERDRGRDP
jgi:branched-chain amino acid transport system permease protein